MVTTDVLYTQNEHTRQIVAAGGHYLFIVKGNQRALHRRLKALPWSDAMLNDRTDTRGQAIPQTGSNMRTFRPWPNARL